MRTSHFWLRAHDVFTSALLCRTIFKRMLEAHSSVCFTVVERCFRIRNDIKKKQAKAILDELAKIPIDKGSADQDSVFDFLF
eukprot:SAG31_NODE_1368_length_8614_cov_12.018203_1_plen_82_part_00